jgi:N-hydroxyarylamine O-acetyltransferase
MTDDAFDLRAWLDRIGYAGSREPSLPVLRALVAHHSAAIPFENIDVLLGRGVRLDPGSLQRKMLLDRRGGYCFEQNSLLLAGLTGLGFQVSGLMARVVRGGLATATTPRTHMLLRVDLPEGPHLADVGFGNLTATAPLALRPDEAQQTPHEDYRLVSAADEWLLEARLDAAWQPIYRFPLQPQFAIDYEVGNWFTSTRPGGLFADNLIVARPGPNQRSTLFNRRFSVRLLSGRVEHREVRGVDAYRTVLGEHFGLILDAPTLETIEAEMQRRGYGDAGHPAFT